MNVKRLLRWLAIAACAGYGGYVVVQGIRDVLARPDRWTDVGAFTLPLLLLYGGLFLTVAYVVWREQYQRLGTFVSALAAVVVFEWLFLFPERIRLYERLPTSVGSHALWIALVTLPPMLVALYSLFMVSRGTIRRGQE